MVRWRSPLDNIEHLLGRVNTGDRMFLTYGDLRDPLSLQDIVRKTSPDYVFHLAAQSFPRASFEAPLDTYETNILGTTSLLEALRQSVPNAVIHVCSSSEVFGRVSRDKLPIDEQCTFHPASPYAISKVGTDLVLCQPCSDAFGADFLPCGIAVGGGGGKAVPGDVDGRGA
jgi:GDPmannose 4,6-dehydratase